MDRITDRFFNVLTLGADGEQYQDMLAPWQRAAGSLMAPSSEARWASITTRSLRLSLRSIT